MTRRNSRRSVLKSEFKAIVASTVKLKSRLSSSYPTLRIVRCPTLLRSCLLEYTCTRGDSLHSWRTFRTNSLKSTIIFVEVLLVLSTSRASFCIRNKPGMKIEHRQPSLAPSYRPSGMKISILVTLFLSNGLGFRLRMSSVESVGLSSEA